MKIKSSISIERPINQVWERFIDITGWKTWYGGAIKSINPTWENGASIGWELGGPSKIIQFDELEFISIKGDGGMITNYYFLDIDKVRTEFSIENDYSVSNVSVSNRSQAENQIRGDLSKFKSYVESFVIANLNSEVKKTAVKDTTVHVEKTMDIEVSFNQTVEEKFNRLFGQLNFTLKNSILKDEGKKGFLGIGGKMKIYTITYIDPIGVQVKTVSEKDDAVTPLNESVIHETTANANLINEVTVVCGKCNHEFNMQLDSHGNQTFGKCPKCNGPVSSQHDQKGKKYSPAQSAAESIIKKYMK